MKLCGINTSQTTLIYGRERGVKYVVSSSKELEYTNTGPMHLGNNEVQRICITSCMGENQIFNDYNPLQKPDIGHTLWLVGTTHNNSQIPLTVRPTTPLDKKTLRTALHQARRYSSKKYINSKQKLKENVLRE
uniref:Uncharacterized protein n=1 Tax=Physcomitrium patens TaxID=3218 RepID=A0A2K1JCW5_PHYPA|nr:hypothetical protein PHYPA_019653 [Physcomitrium patens]